MNSYRLVAACAADEAWLDTLRRDVYRELFDATWGGWDESRHRRHFHECWSRGGISIIVVREARIGMIQVFELADTVQVAEIQIAPNHQNLGIGTQVLTDVIERSHQQQRRVVLSVGLKNDRAYQLYRRLGFRHVGSNDTHNHMAHVPATMTREALGSALLQTCLLRGKFQLRSGVVADEYFDKYRFESNPVLLRATAEHLAAFLPADVQALAGLELGGVPIATALSQQAGVPALFVRKAEKEYGTRRLVEGGDVEGKRIVVVEDVVTSGGQLLQSSIQLRNLGAIVLAVLCVVDRESGGKQSLRSEGFELRSLFTLAELRRLAERA